jgi:hypothetical protein
MESGELLPSVTIFFFSEQNQHHFIIEFQWRQKERFLLEVNSQESLSSSQLSFGIIGSNSTIGFLLLRRIGATTSCFISFSFEITTKK